MKLLSQWVSGSETRPQQQQWQQPQQNIPFAQHLATQRASTLTLAGARWGDFLGSLGQRGRTPGGVERARTRRHETKVPILHLEWQASVVFFFSGWLAGWLLGWMDGADFLARSCRATTKGGCSTAPSEKKNSRGQKRKHSQDRGNYPADVSYQGRRQSNVPNEQDKLWLLCVGVVVTLRVVVSSFMLAPTGTAIVFVF